MTAALRVDFLDDTFHFNEMYVKDEWEPKTKATLARFLLPGDTFVDVGAWIGPVTMWAVDLGAEVVALEPDSEAFKSLAINVEGHPVTCLPEALSDHDGASLIYNPRFFGDSQSRLGVSPEADFKDPSRVRMVQCITVSTLLTGLDPALIKVDIEGHETVIMDALTTAARARDIPLHISWHEPWWTWKPDRRVFHQWFEGFELEGVIGGWGTLVAIPEGYSR